MNSTLCAQGGRSVISYKGNLGHEFASKVRSDLSVDAFKDLSIALNEVLDLGIRTAGLLKLFSSESLSFTLVYLLQLTEVLLEREQRVDDRLLGGLVLVFAGVV